MCFILNICVWLTLRATKCSVDKWSTEWRIDRKKKDDWPKKNLIKFLYIL